MEAPGSRCLSSFALPPSDVELYRPAADKTVERLKVDAYIIDGLYCVLVRSYTCEFSYHLAVGDKTCTSTVPGTRGTYVRSTRSIVSNVVFGMQHLLNSSTSEYNLSIVCSRSSSSVGIKVI